ncbi:glycosyltransferase [Candidatus Woesearchaeota archaeon]|nr:glycosyltransferase [Candidatus Woesearchaeota archaeon]
MPKRELSIIIPTYNEKEIIADSITRIFRNFDRYKIKDVEVVIVDDSRDGTEKILKKLSKSYKNLRFIHRQKSRGVGSAIREGISRASGKYGIIFMSDAPDDIRYVPSILEKIRDGCDFVHTSRFMKGSKIEGYPFIKTLANRLANYSVRFAFLRLDLKDFTSLFKGFRIDKIKELGLEANEFDIGLEIALKAIRKNYKIAEVPVNWKEREAGKSKLRLSKQAPAYAKRIVKIFFTYW